MITIFICLALTSAVNARSYSGYQLVSVFPEQEKHLEVLKYIENQGQLDFWKSSYEQFDILLPPSDINHFARLMKSLECPFYVAIPDIQIEIDAEKDRLKEKKAGFDYDNFNKLDEINKELDRLASKCIAGFVCRVDSLGSSVEKRPIKRLKISKAGAPRKAIWLDATTHAREWLTTATLFKIVKNLFDNYGKPGDATNLLDKYDFYFVPVVNPDGYEYSWTKDRLWRKNKRVNTGSVCIGVDLNRNADAEWGTVGSSPLPCAQTYRGASVASEPETKVIQDGLKAVGSSLVELVTLHSYGNYWLIPFGFKDNKTNSCFKAPDAAETLRVANAAANAIEKVYNTSWKRGDACSVIYPASGGMMDFAKLKAGIVYSAVPETRGSSFVVQPSEIERSFREIWAGLVASTQAIEKKPLFRVFHRNLINSS